MGKRARADIRSGQPPRSPLGRCAGAPLRATTRSIGTWGLFLLAACASTGRSIPLPDHLVGVSAEFQPALVALRSAVNDHEDQTARQVLARILARDPQGDALALARGFERILEGRRVLSDLATSIVFEDVEGGIEVFQVWVNIGEEAVALHPGPASLRLERETLDARGRQARIVRTQVLSDFGPWEVPPGGTARSSLGIFSLEVPADSMALRVRWTVTHLPGHLTVGGRELPAQVLPRPTASRDVLAPFLPRQPVSADVWLACARSARSSTAELLERTVRLESDARVLVLNELAAEAPHLGLHLWGRLVPALRWLVPEARHLDSPELWRAYLGQMPPQGGARAIRGEGRESGRGALDIPSLPRR